MPSPGARFCAALVAVGVQGALAARHSARAQGVITGREDARRAQCDMADRDRVDCGHMGIDQGGCESQGCCWKPTGSPGAPWCYRSSGGAGPSTGGGQCAVPDYEKRDCGFLGVTQDACEGKGCCWAASSGGSPWCFEKKGAGGGGPTGGEQCAVSDYDKRDCGFLGVTQDTCEGKGCCWATSSSGSPWCFEKKGSGGGPRPAPHVGPAGPAHAEVYVMLSLTTVSNEGRLNRGEASWHLDKIREANADGFMVDVWWGLTERQPKVYDFGPYLELLGMAEQRGLKVQFVASFHQCGGNVGDDCFIPLPAWVTKHSDIWFTDQHGNQNKEYISFFADDVALEGGRTPLDMYGDWLAALAAALEGKLGNTVTEVQVGMGPCGELRYPSYYTAHGWQFPGIGEFQAYDKHALAALAAAGGSKPPGDAGSYNSKPGETPFFTGGFKSDYGRHFLSWYFDTMKTHGAEVLRRASTAVNGTVALAGKVAGIHWWYGSESHAAELTAGYYNADGRDAYAEIAGVFAGQGHTSLDFTCLEMRNSEQSAEWGCKPEDLVGQVQRAAQSKTIHFNGENALPRYDWAAYEKILQWKRSLSAFTYLRACQQLMSEGFDAFKGFVSQMHQG